MTPFIGPEVLMISQCLCCSFDKVQQKLSMGLICLIKPVVRKPPHRVSRSFSVSDWVTTVTLLTCLTKGFHYLCFRAPSLFFHSIFSHLPLIFKRDGLIFPEIPFLSVWLMPFLRPSAPFVHFTFALVLSPIYQIDYFKVIFVKNQTDVLLENQIK